MIEKIHPIVETYVLSKIDKDDVDDAKSLMNLAKTFSGAGVKPYAECLKILSNMLRLPTTGIYDELKKHKIDSSFLDLIYPLPF